jgi:hypothetical protein
MTEKVTIKVSLFVETRLDMEVSWDEDIEEVVIHSVERDAFQSDIHVDRLGEYASEDDLEYIEEKAAKALGIERD